MLRRNLIVIAIAVVSLLFAGNVFGQGLKQKSRSKTTVKKPTSVLLEGKKPGSFYIHINPIRSKRKPTSFGAGNQVEARTRKSSRKSSKNEVSIETIERSKKTRKRRN